MVTSASWHASKIYLRASNILVYINDLAKNLSLTTKLFADVTSIFSVVHDTSLSSLPLNDDLIKISNQAYQWKISFNPEVTKQAQEVVFSHKSQKAILLQDWKNWLLPTKMYCWTIKIDVTKLQVINKRQK